PLRDLAASAGIKESPLTTAGRALNKLTEGSGIQPGNPLLLVEDTINQLGEMRAANLIPHVAAADAAERVAKGDLEPWHAMGLPVGRPRPGVAKPGAARTLSKAQGGPASGTRPTRTASPITLGEFVNEMEGRGYTVEQAVKAWNRYKLGDPTARDLDG